MRRFKALVFGVVSRSQNGNSLSFFRESARYLDGSGKGSSSTTSRRLMRKKFREGNKTKILTFSINERDHIEYLVGGCVNVLQRMETGPLGDEKDMALFYDY